MGGGLILKLIYKGAEANLYLDEWFGLKVIRKVRASKLYRVSELDRGLRLHRTVNEAKLLSAARRVGVLTPFVFDVDLRSFTLVMEYLNGALLKDLLPSLSDDMLKSIFFEVGRMIGRLHHNGIYHGDLTTSNMVVIDGVIFFIDFGLGGFSNELESFGVDLHLMLRALESTHHDLAERCFSYVKAGYSEVYDDWVNVFHKVDEIRRRGRYVAVRSGADE